MMKNQQRCQQILLISVYKQVNLSYINSL